jgi:hypothetical protein
MPAISFGIKPTVQDCAAAHYGCSGESTSPSSANRDPLALGLFIPNCSNSPSIRSDKPNSYDQTFESNLKISQAAQS